LHWNHHQQGSPRWERGHPARLKAGEPPVLPGFLTETGDFDMTLLNRFHLYYVLLAHGKKCTLPRATALEWGVCGNLVPSRTHR
jgi:hypothetical protein